MKENRVMSRSEDGCPQVERQQGMLQQVLDELCSEIDALRDQIGRLEDTLQTLLPQIKTTETDRVDNRKEAMPSSDIITLARIQTLTNNCRELVKAINRIQETVAV